MRSLSPQSSCDYMHLLVSRVWRGGVGFFYNILHSVQDAFLQMQRSTCGLAVSLGFLLLPDGQSGALRAVPVAALLLLLLLPGLPSLPPSSAQARFHAERQRNTPGWCNLLRTPLVCTVPRVSTQVITVLHREMKTGISEASKRVSIFSFATQGGKQVSFYFRQRNWVQAREAQIRFPAG